MQILPTRNEGEINETSQQVSIEHPSAQSPSLTKLTSQHVRERSLSGSRSLRAFVAGNPSKGKVTSLATLPVLVCRRWLRRGRGVEAAEEDTCDESIPLSCDAFDAVIRALNLAIWEILCSSS